MKIIYWEKKWQGDNFGENMEKEKERVISKRFDSIEEEEKKTDRSVGWYYCGRESLLFDNRLGNSYEFSFREKKRTNKKEEEKEIEWVGNGRIWEREQERQILINGQNRSNLEIVIISSNVVFDSFPSESFSKLNHQHTEKRNRVQISWWIRRNPLTISPSLATGY